MTRCYLDANFLYAQRRPARDPVEAARQAAWRARVEELAGNSPVFVSALALDELAYRLCLAWLRDDGHSDPLAVFRADPSGAMRRTGDRLRQTWSALEELGLELVATDEQVVSQAQALMAEPGLAPRDAFHAAHALRARCRVFVSSGAGFDAVPSLRRLSP